AGVALKEERRPVLVPRGTPLSAIHLEALLTLRRAGALIMPAMPAFYTHPQTLQDAIDFVAGRGLDLVGLDAGLRPAWGRGGGRGRGVKDEPVGGEIVPGSSTGPLPPERVQAMFDRIAGPYDTMNRVMTVGLDRRWRALAADATGVGAGASVLDVCCGTGDLT